MNLSGKTVVLTGATTGIGRAAALALADQPARLVIHGPQAAREVSGLTHLLQAAMQPGAELTYLHSDYSDLASVAQLAQDIRSSAGRIDVLINNAARPGAPARTLSSDGNEITLQTNYLAPVALTTLILDAVASAGHRGRYSRRAALCCHVHRPSGARGRRARAMPADAGLRTSVRLQPNNGAAGWRVPAAKRVISAGRPGR